MVLMFETVLQREWLLMMEKKFAEAEKDDALMDEMMKLTFDQLDIHER
tara:strand:- start:405 stop:548 length:144 start_codon:yes stop_codon:yes gene_type:complete